MKIFDVPLTALQVLDDFNGITNTTNLHNHWDMDDDLVDQGSGLDNGTDVGADGILTNNYSEFTSRLKHSTAAPLVADTVSTAIDSLNNVGHAVVIQAA